MIKIPGVTEADGSELARVVLIDDNAADNIYHKLILRDLFPDLDIVTFSGGREALDGLLSSQGRGGWSLILVDLNMPAMTGWEFIDRFFAEIDDDLSTVVVLSTTENPAETKRAREHDDVSGFMSKPLDAFKLRKLVAAA